MDLLPIIKQLYPEKYQQIAPIVNALKDSDNVNRDLVLQLGYEHRVNLALINARKEIDPDRDEVTVGFMQRGQDNGHIVTTLCTYKADKTMSRVLYRWESLHDFLNTVFPTSTAK